MRTFSVNAAAELLERDRRTITRALRGVRPDGKDGNKARWKMRTIVDSLQAYETRGSIANEPATLADEIEAAFEKLEKGLAKLEAEPSLKRRREIDAELAIGKLIGRLDPMMQRANAESDERVMLSVVSDKLIGEPINRFLTLMNLMPTEAELYAIRNRHKATCDSQ